MAYSPLAMGRLTGKYSSTNKPQVSEASSPRLVLVWAPSAVFPGSVKRFPPPVRPPQGARRFGDYGFERIQPIVDRLSVLGQAHGGRTPAQVALNWLICKGAVPIPGAKSAAQVC